MIVFPLARSVGLKGATGSSSTSRKSLLCWFQCRPLYSTKSSGNCRFSDSISGDRRPGCTDFPGCAAHSRGGCPRHVETLQQHYFSDDPRWKDLRSVELRDIGIRNSLLIIIDVKDGGSVRGTTSEPWRLSCVGSWATEKKMRSNWP